MTEDIVKFTPIQGGEVPEFSDAELSVLSNNVQYLYRMFRLVTIGSKVCLCLELPIEKTNSARYSQSLSQYSLSKMGN